MSYWILVFNQRTIHEIDPKMLIAALTRSNFNTLCRQYKLDLSQIKPALENLSIQLAPEGTALAFLLSYRPVGGPPTAIYHWPAGGEKGKALLAQALTDSGPGIVSGHLQICSQIIGIELSSAQLQDMGLLLGYEVARWAAEQGKGIVRGLDGIWYRLNSHLAFLPIEDAAP